MNDREKGVGCALVVMFFVMCLGCGGCIMVGENQYSDGHRDGHLQKISKKGVIWKTMEAEVAMPGFQAKGEAVSNIWAFTIHDPSVFDDLQKVQADQMVRFYYKQVWFALPWNGSTDYRVYKFELLKK